MSLLAAVALRSSIVLLAGLGLHAAMRNRAAAIRHLVLASALGATAAVVPLSLTLPAWDLSLSSPRPASARSAPQAVNLSLAPTGEEARNAAKEHRVGTERRAGNDHQTASATALRITAGVWFAGFLATAALLGAGAVRLRGIASSGQCVDDPRWLETSATVARGYRLRRRIAIVQTDRTAYTLQASLPGFHSMREEFDLSARQDWNRAVILQVGNLRETVIVSAKRGPTPAASAALPSQRIRVGGSIRVPTKLVDVRPIYPVSMQQAGLEGDVPIDAIIGRDGTVTSVRVLSADVHPDFAIAAADAVRQWRFTPTLLNGSPVEVVMTVSVSFKLSDQ